MRSKSPNPLLKAVLSANMASPRTEHLENHLIILRLVLASESLSNLHLSLNPGDYVYVSANADYPPEYPH